MTAKPRKVWAVSSGEYSDYCVNAVFETEADAQAAVANGFGEDVSEMTLYPAGVAPVKRIEWRAWATVGSKADNDEEPYVTSDVEWDLMGNDRASKRPVLRERPNGLGVSLSTLSSDREAAMKVVADRYAELKAQREGL